MQSCESCGQLVVSLPRPERLFLWAIRAWSASHTDLTAVWWSLDRAFTQEGVQSALAPFHELMSALFAGLKRWPEIHCVASPYLGHDEMRLLSSFTHLQSGNELGMQAALGDWVQRAAIRKIRRHVAECVTITALARMRFTFIESAAPLSFPVRPREERAGLFDD